MQYLGSHELVIHLEKEGTTLAITLFLGYHKFLFYPQMQQKPEKPKNQNQ